jgi:hypothetical protein
VIIVFVLIEIDNNMQILLIMLYILPFLSLFLFGHINMSLYMFLFMFDYCCNSPVIIIECNFTYLLYSTEDNNIHSFSTNSLETCDFIFAKRQKSKSFNKSELRLNLIAS